MKDLDTGEIIRREEIEKRISNINIDSEGVIKSSMKRINDIVFVIPRSVISYLKGLDRMYRNVEFSIFLNVSFDSEQSKFIVDENSIHLPKQNVSIGHIDYLEGSSNYNLVIHKHPDGCKSFSSIDRDYINSNFQFSLLWVDNKIERGISNFEISDGIYLEVPIKKIEIFDECCIPQNTKEKITISVISENDKSSRFRNLLDNEKDFMDFFYGPGIPDFPYSKRKG